MVRLRLGLLAALVSLCAADSEPVNVCKIQRPLFVADADKPKFSSLFSIPDKTEVSDEAGVKVVKCAPGQKLGVLKQDGAFFEAKDASLKCEKEKQQWVFVEGDKTTPYAGEKVGCFKRDPRVMISPPVDPPIIFTDPVNTKLVVPKPLNSSAVVPRVLTDPVPTVIKNPIPKLINSSKVETKVLTDPLPPPPPALVSKELKSLNTSVPVKPILTTDPGLTEIVKPGNISITKAGDAPKDKLLTDPGVTEIIKPQDPSKFFNDTKAPISKDPVGPIVKPPKQADGEKKSAAKPPVPETPCGAPRLASGDELVIPPHLKFVAEETGLKQGDDGVWRLECSELFAFWDVDGFTVREKPTWSLECADKNWIVRRQGDGKDGGYNPKVVVGCFRKRADDEPLTYAQPKDKSPCGNPRLAKGNEEVVPTSLIFKPDETKIKYGDDGRWKLECSDTIAWWDINGFAVQEKNTWSLECIGKQWIWRKHSDENDGPLRPSNVVGCYKKREQDEPVAITQPSGAPPCGNLRLPKESDERIPVHLEYSVEESAPKYGDDGRWRLECSDTIAWWDINSFTVQEKTSWSLECVGKQWIFRKHSKENDGPLKPSTVIGCFKKKDED